VVYGLSTKEMKIFWSRICILCLNTTIWPDPRDLMMGGSKLFLDTLIGFSARSANYSHVQCVPITASVECVRRIAEKELAAVLKREFSSHGQHVFTPDTKEAVTTFEKAHDREEVTYDWEIDFPRPKWFMQPFLPGLKYLGEIRVFIVNGVIFKWIITTPDGERPLQITQPNMLTPMSKLRYDATVGCY